MNTKEIIDKYRQLDSTSFMQHGLASLQTTPIWIKLETVEDICSTLRQSVLEEVREKMPKKEEHDEGYENCEDYFPMDCYVCHHNKFIDQVTSLINNLIEEKK